MDKIERRKVERVVAENIINGGMDDHNRERFIEAALFLALDALEGIMVKSGGRYNCSSAIQGIKSIQHLPEMLAITHKKGFNAGVEMMTGIEKFSRAELERL